MTVKNVIGLLMLFSFFVFLFVMTAVSDGLKEACILWGLTLVASAFVILAAYLITS